MDTTTTIRIPDLSLKGDQVNCVEAVATFGDRLYVGVTSRADADGEAIARIFRTRFDEPAWEKVSCHSVPAPFVEIDGRLRHVWLHQGFRAFSIIERAGIERAGSGEHSLVAPLISVNGSRLIEIANGAGIDVQDHPNLSAKPDLPPMGEVVSLGGRLFAIPASYSAGSPPVGSSAFAAGVFVADHLDSGLWTAACEPGFGLPDNEAISHLEVLNEVIYASTVNRQSGFQLWRTDARGAPPFRWEPVIEQGAHRYTLNKAVTFLSTLDGGLFVGTAALAPGKLELGNHGPEILRVGADGFWDVIVGSPRFSPDGLKLPLSTHGPGFGDSKNAAITCGAAAGNRLTICVQEFAATPEISPDAGHYGGAATLWTGERIADWKRLPASPLRRLKTIRAMCFTPVGLVVGGEARKARAGSEPASPLVIVSRTPRPGNRH